MYGRVALAVMDANENKERRQDTTADGQLKFRIMVHCTVLRYTALLYNALHCTALNSTTLPCPKLHYKKMS